jgi:FMN phosphatase YigB (HAD superfamily)
MSTGVGLIGTPVWLYETTHGFRLSHLRLLWHPHRLGIRDLGCTATPAAGHWTAFPDSADALRLLQTKYRLIVLSNVDHAGLAASTRKLGVEFDAV